MRNEISLMSKRVNEDPLVEVGKWKRTRIILIQLGQYFDEWMCSNLKAPFHSFQLNLCPGYLCFEWRPRSTFWCVESKVFPEILLWISVHEIQCPMAFLRMILLNKFSSRELDYYIPRLYCYHVKSSTENIRWPLTWKNGFKQRKICRSTRQNEFPIHNCYLLHIILNG